MQCSLPRWILAQSSLNDTTHDHFINIRRADTRTLDRLAHDHCPKLRRLENLSTRRETSLPVSAPR